MTPQEIIDAISALTKVVEANKGFVMGSESTMRAANEKIKQLIKLLPENKI